MGTMICIQLPKAETHLLSLTLAVSNPSKSQIRSFTFFINLSNSSIITTLGNYHFQLCPAPGKPLKSLIHQHCHSTARNPLNGLCALNIASLIQSLYFIVLKYQVSSQHYFAYNVTMPLMIFRM